MEMLPGKLIFMDFSHIRFEDRTSSRWLSDPACGRSDPNHSFSVANSGNSMTRHRIELRGPWEVISPAGEDADASRVPLPQSWKSLFGQTAGRAIFLRSFHRPTNLEARERVYLLFGGCGGRGSVFLNDVPLGELSSDAGREFDVTDHLRQRNRLRVEIEFDPALSTSPGGISEAVALEIG